MGGGEGRSQPASPTKVTVVLAAMCPLVEICGASGEGGKGRDLLGAGSAPPGESAGGSGHGSEDREGERETFR